MYQIAYQRQVNVIAMSNHSKVFLQLIVITLLGDKQIFDKTQRMCISLNSQNVFFVSLHCQDLGVVEKILYNPEKYTHNLRFGRV